MDNQPQPNPQQPFTPQVPVIQPPAPSETQPPIGDPNVQATNEQAPVAYAAAPESFQPQATYPAPTPVEAAPNPYQQPTPQPINSFTPVPTPVQQAPIAPSQTVYGFNEQQNRSKKPLKIAIGVAIAVVIVGGSVLGLFLGANATASSYKTAFAQQWKEGKKTFDESTANVQSAADFDKLKSDFDTFASKKTSLATIPFGEYLSKSYKEAKDADKEATAYFLQAGSVLTDTAAISKADLIGKQQSTDMQSAATVDEVIASINRTIKGYEALSAKGTEAKQVLSDGIEANKTLLSDAQAVSSALKAKNSADYSSALSKLQSDSTAGAQKLSDDADKYTKYAADQATGITAKEDAVKKFLGLN